MKNCQSYCFNMRIFCREAAFHELGVYSKNDGNAVGIFSPKNVRNILKGKINKDLILILVAAFGQSE